MNVTQLAVIRAVLRHPEEPLTRVAEDLAMDRTSLYRMLLTMQRMKWIAVRHGEDGRSQAASVSERGRNVLATADRSWAEMQAKIIGMFGQASWKAFVSELNRLIECAEAASRSRPLAEVE